MYRIVRTRWNLAVTLLNEIAHAAWALLREDKSTGPEKNEPCFDITQTYMCGELGWAPETHLFCGYVISTRFSAHLGSANFEFCPADADHNLAFPIIRIV
ncbi:hypothetical protein K505DRAFT_320610 [Melanomma pulvis-pyrius CBS 109.77]|uniref:Uncharacterized protein n=1 Tax=Melanomma pulvis-pyrius CBS 109.77 TaxID=1314802 RepID=A0A6A6XUV9_9PLEO|nr:hypothetical protein K505DRAFT_320610 [Melanomma pulvis-pyrius CBS 109.77]